MMYISQFRKLELFSSHDPYMTWRCLTLTMSQLSIPLTRTSSTGSRSSFHPSNPLSGSSPMLNKLTLPPIVHIDRPRSSTEHTDELSSPESEPSPPPQAHTSSSTRSIPLTVATRATRATPVPAPPTPGQSSQLELNLTQLELESEYPNPNPTPSPSTQQRTNRHVLDGRSKSFEYLFVATCCGAQLIAQGQFGMVVIPIAEIGRHLGTSDPGELSWIAASYG